MSGGWLNGERLLEDAKRFRWLARRDWCVLGEPLPDGRCEATVTFAVVCKRAQIDSIRKLIDEAMRAEDKK